MGVVVELVTVVVGKVVVGVVVDSFTVVLDGAIVVKLATVVLDESLLVVVVRVSFMSGGRGAAGRSMISVSPSKVAPSKGGVSFCVAGTEIETPSVLSK